MRALIFFITLSLAAIAASSADQTRIVGGSQTVIEQYPFSAALLTLILNNFRQLCGGSIINNRSILTAAHCFDGRSAIGNWRIRVGSTNAHSGGALHNVNRILVHPNYSRITLDSDIALLRSASAFSFNDRTRPGAIAGASFNVRDNIAIWAIGWGAIGYQGGPSEQLRHVQFLTVSQAECRRRYAVVPRTITDNMLCSGWLDRGFRGQCHGDSGSPVLEGHIIIGVTSWGELCAQPRFPSVNVRVTRFASWISSNA